MGEGAKAADDGVSKFQPGGHEGHHQSTTSSPDGGTGCRGQLRKIPEEKLCGRSNTPLILRVTSQAVAKLQPNGCPDVFAGSFTKVLIEDLFHFGKFPKIHFPLFR